MKKELIILSGFLGSGKTTLLRSLLRNFAERRVAVLLNDFGECPVDGAILERAGIANGMFMEIGGGSVFCACLRESFVKALLTLAERDEEVIILEASGMADPAAVDRLLALSGLDRLYDHTATVCLFDPIKSLKLARVLEVIPRQLVSASVVVLAKADIAGPEELGAARAYIRQQVPSLPIVESRNGEPEVPLFPIQRAPCFPLGFNTPENRPDCLVLESVPTDAASLLDALRDNPNVLRVKGYIRASDGILFVSDTGMGFETASCKDAPTPLVIICMQGTAASVRAAMHAVGIELPA